MVWRVIGVGAALVLFAGAAWTVTSADPVAAPLEPSRLPVLPVLPTDFEGVSLADRLGPGVIADVHRDDFLNSPVLNDPDFARAVHAWVRYWTGPAQAWFPGFLDRMAWLGPSVDSAIDQRGFPPSLRYLPLIESGYDPTVTSRASAVGLWQLMAGTGGALGLEISPLVDERRDPERATEAAMEYLDELHGRFGSWFVALAAYNSGPTRVRRILRNQAPGVEVNDSVFWALRGHFPEETRAFLPKLFGAMWVASHPEAYGYSPGAAEPFDFEVVRVPHPTTLDVVGLAAGVPHEEIVRLNPEYLRGITVRDGRNSVRLPRGRLRTFLRIYPRIHPQDLVNFEQHTVLAGETLSGIAARYDIPISEIRAINPHARAATLGVGTKLTLPVAPPAP